MKRFLGILLMIALLLVCAAAAADVSLDAAHFPDAAFRDFIGGYDENGDRVLQDREIAQITGLECNDMGITSLKGIEYLTALEWIDCYNNQITEADFSHNLNINSISMYSNLLKSIDVSKNTNLMMLGVSNNRLTSLKLPNAKNLYSLDVTSNNGIKELDISKNPLLVEAVKKAEPTSYIYWDGGYALNWIIDEPNRYIFFAVDKWVKVKANGETVVDPVDVEEFRYEGVRYSVNKKKKTGTVIGVTDRKKTEVYVIDTFELAGVTYKVTGIDDGAFKGMTKLKKLTIGSNVTAIGKDACNGCKKLQNVTILSAKLKSIGAGAFKGTTAKATYRCPEKKLSKYKKMLIQAGAAKNSKFIGE